MWCVRRKHNGLVVHKSGIKDRIHGRRVSSVLRTFPWCRGPVNWNEGEDVLTEQLELEPRKSPCIHKIEDNRSKQTTLSAAFISHENLKEFTDGEPRARV